MNLLGLSVFVDSSAALVRQGRIVHAVEEERLNRIKHYEGLPWLALEECLTEGGLTIREMDALAVGWNPFRGWHVRMGQSLRSIFAMPAAFTCKVVRGQGYLHACRQILTLRQALEHRYGCDDLPCPIHYVPHHLAHAASAFFCSPYDSANVIVADGIGESATISFFTGSGNRLQEVGHLRFPHSLGHLYASVTGFLGFRMAYDEGKVMALAGFGRDTFRDLFAQVLKINPARGTVHLNTRLLDYHAAREGLFSQQWICATGLESRRPGEPLTPRHEDLACSLQVRLQEAVLSLLKARFPQHSERPLCAAGGLFLNSVLNGKISREYIPDFYIQPAAGDNGVSLGAALAVQAAFNPQSPRHVMNDAFLGKSYDSSDFVRVLGRRNLNINPARDVYV